MMKEMEHKTETLSETSGEARTTELTKTEPIEEPVTFPEFLAYAVIGPINSKNARKRELRFEKRTQLMKTKRPLERQRRKEKKLAARQRQQARATPDSPYVNKKEERKRLHEKLETALVSGVKLVVDMSFADLMSTKEIGQLASQINYMYSTNKRMQQPFCMHLCSLEKGTELRDEVEKRCPGFENYKIKVYEEPLERVFPAEDVIYLSPDSPNTLTEVDPKKVYVIGGLVDGTPKREVSLSRAKEIGCQTAKLPIKEHMTRVTPHGHNTILTLNQVYEILMTFNETKSWETALKVCVPQRKGFKLTGDVDKSSISDSKPTSESVIVMSGEVGDGSTECDLAANSLVDSIME